MFSLNEQILIRAWIRGVPLASLDIPLNPGIFALLGQLRVQLHLKALRIQRPDADLWLKRRNHAAWERAALHDLDYLLQHADIPPKPQQPLSFWLAPQQADALTAAHLYTLEDIVQIHQSKGKAWWKGIPGFGYTSAKQLTATLEALLPGLLAQKRATMPIVYTTGIVPLERFLLPAELDGTQGRNRAAADPFIPMPHDLAAIQAWLALLEPTSHTRRSYQREAERLLLWAILAKQKALSALDATDLVDYRRFLKNPQPADTWVGPPQHKGHKQWKPFTGALSLRSIQYAETVLNGLFGFLVRQRYLQHNPYTVLPKRKIPDDQVVIGVHRAFSPTQWALITDAAGQAMQHSTGQAKRKALRTQLILNLAYATGLRLHELTQATVGDLVILTRQAQAQQWLKVIGKGQKLRQVPLPPTAWTSLCDSYRALTGQALLKQDSNCPLIPDLRDAHKALKPLAVHKAMKTFFTQVATLCAADDPESAVHLAQASTHWLRHTHGSVAVEQNIPLTMIRDNLGHASISTTSHYLHSDADARYEAFKQFAAIPLPNDN